MTTDRLFRPGWPLAAVLCLYPVWWLLGIGEFAFVLFAIPMAWQLRLWRPIKLPPGFGFWLLFLAWNIVSLVMLPFSSSDSNPGSSSGRIIAIVIRLMQFVAVTIIGLYVVNLPAQQVSSQRIVKWLSTLFIITMVGGFFGLVAPHFSIKSPLEYVLPHGIDANRYVKTLVHPQAAEVQSVLGYSAPRPAAPWGYTNFWGNDISILMLWFCVRMAKPPHSSATLRPRRRDRAFADPDHLLTQPRSLVRPDHLAGVSHLPAGQAR